MASVQAGDVVASSSKTAIAKSGEESLFDIRATVREIFFGSIAGMVAEIFEYPFDLAKVRLQAQLLVPSSSPNTTLRFNGPLHCLLQTWKEEGVRGLYRGLPVPVAGSMAETASVFLTYTFFQNVIRTLSPLPRERSKTAPLSLPQLGLASAGAGFVTSFVLTPVELLKCKMQVQMMSVHPPLPPSNLQVRMHHRHSSILPATTILHPNTLGHQSIHAIACDTSTSKRFPKLPGVIKLTQSILSTDGVRGLWLGHTGTILRETGGCAAWFVSKEWFARKLVERRLGKMSCSNVTLLSWESGLSGAAAGAVGALVCYPADTVKSAIQTEEDLLKSSGIISNARDAHKRNTFTNTFRRMWVMHGLKGLYAGCGMTVARAVPSSGIIFVVYDGLSAKFSQGFH